MHAIVKWGFAVFSSLKQCDIRTPITFSPGTWSRDASGDATALTAAAADAATDAGMKKDDGRVSFQ